MDNSFKETIDYKSKKIGKAMDAKDKSMAIMAAGRDATMVVTVMLSTIGLDKYTDEMKERVTKEELKKWRNWFYYEIYTRDPDDQLEQEAKEKGVVEPFPSNQPKKDLF